MQLYLSYFDPIIFNTPNKILEYQKTTIENRNVLTVKIEIPIIGQEYGYRDKDIYTLFLVNRFEEDESAFINLNKFPLFVHVLIPNIGNIEVGYTPLSQFVDVAWACLYDNYPDAESHTLK